MIAAGRPILMSIALSSTLLVTGCSTKKASREFNTQIRSSEVEMSMTDGRVRHMTRKEKRHAPYIDLSVSKKLSTALEELGEIRGRAYILGNKDNDFVLEKVGGKACRRLFVDSFRKLKRFVENTTRFTLVKRRVSFNGGVTVVDVVDKEAERSDLSDITFTVRAGAAIPEVVRAIAKKTGFSIVYTHGGGMGEGGQNPLEDGGNDTLTYFESGHKSVADFLNYVASMKNLYVDIDYGAKIIKFTKYKTKIFELAVPKLNLKVKNVEAGSISGSQDNGGGTGGEESATVTNNSEIEVAEDLVKSVESIASQDGGSVYVNDGGLLVVTASRNAMSTIGKLIDKYNGSFTTQMNISVEVYEFVLSKDYQLNADVSFNRQTSDGENSTGVGFETKNVLDAIFGMVFEQKGVNPMKMSVNVGSENDFIRFSKKYLFRSIFTNNIPQDIRLITSKDYVKSIKTTTTTGTATTTQTEMEIGNIAEGQTLTILPRVYGNKVFLKTELKINAINDIPTVTFDGGSISLPDVSQKIIPNSTVMDFGEKRLIGIYETYEDAKRYSGVLPSEFIIGRNGKSYVRKLFAVFISATRGKWDNVSMYK